MHSRGRTCRERDPTASNQDGTSQSRKLRNHKIHAIKYLWVQKEG